MQAKLYERDDTFIAIVTTAPLVDGKPEIIGWNNRLFIHSTNDGVDRYIAAIYTIALGDASTQNQATRRKRK